MKCRLKYGSKHLTGLRRELLVHENVRDHISALDHTEGSLLCISNSLNMI